MEGTMHIRWLLTLCLVLSSTAPILAQTSWQFRWQQGETLTYKVNHLTHVTEVVENKKAESQSKLNLVKRWQVSDVDGKGIATLELSLTAMRNEQKRTNGDSMLFDSQNLDKSTPELREQMSKFIGKTLAILRVDRYGRIIEVKQGSAARYEAETPFVIVFPDAQAAAGQIWRRPYTLVMEPPHGTGEKYQAEQRYECKKIEADKAFLAVSTQFKTMPDNTMDRLPLLQKEVQGDLVFDLKAGKLTSVQFATDKTIENHQGKGSSYRFQSQYTEVLVDQ
jgi:hypothetical protein